MEKQRQKPKISFIIPVYETPLATIQSLLNTFQKASERDSSLPFEIVIVEDGSHVLGLENFCLSLSSKLEVRYFWQENKGPAAARTTGIERCTGEYLAFVDSDDKIEEDLFSTISSAMKEGLDLIIFPYFLESENTTLKTRVQRHSLHQILISLFFASYKGISSYGGDEGWYGYLWRYLYRKEFLTEKEVHFEQSLTSGEDNCFLIDVFLSGATFSYADKGYYHYCFNTSSLSRRLTPCEIIFERDEKLIQALERRGLSAIEKGLLTEKEFHQALYCRISTFAYVNLQNSIRLKMNYSSAKEIFRRYQFLAKKHRTRLNGNIKLVKRFFAFLFSHHCTFLCYLFLKGLTR